MVDWWRGFGDWGGLLWGGLAGFVEAWCGTADFVPGTFISFVARHTQSVSKSLVKNSIH